MQTPSPAPIEYVSNLKRALIYGQITEKDFYPFSPVAPGLSFLSSTVKGTQTIVDQTRRAWKYGQMTSAIVQDLRLLRPEDSFGGPAPSDFVDDLRRSLLYGGISYTDLGGFYIPPYGATFWRDFTKFQTLNHGTGIPLSCTRSGSASYIGSDGQMKIAQVDEPRFDYDPVTLKCKGLLCEVTRKNFFRNSEVGQSQGPIAVVSGTYNLSFYGTGSVTLSGAINANIVGSGAYPTRRSSVFTILNTGNINVVVSGTVQYMQLESGSFPTSWIPTGAVPSLDDTRAQDLIESSQLGFSPSEFNNAQGTLYASFIRYQTALQRAGFINFRSSGQNFYSLQSGTGNQCLFHQFRKRPGNSDLETIVSDSIANAPGTIYKLAGAYNNFDNSSNAYKLYQNGSNVGLILVRNDLLPQNPYRVQLGRVSDDGSLHGWLREVSYMPTTLSVSNLISLTT